MTRKYEIYILYNNNNNPQVHDLLVEIPVPVTVNGLLLALGGRVAPFGIALGSLVGWLTSGGVMGCGLWLATKVVVTIPKSFTSTGRTDCNIVMI